MKKKHVTTFFRLCQAAQAGGQLHELFDLFFTKEELEMLGARCEIVEALLKGEMTQRELAAKHHVSIAQITRGSNALKSTSSTLQELLADFRW